MIKNNKMFCVFILFIHPFVCYGWSFTNPFDTKPTIDKCINGINDIGNGNGEFLVDEYGSNKELIVKSCMFAAENGKVRAQEFLGNFYSSKDAIKSFQWHKRAADQGSVASAFHIGTDYKFGNGVIQNNDEALKWLMICGKKGHYSIAFVHIGDIYRERNNIVDAYAAYSVALAIGNAPWQDSNLTNNIRNLAAHMTEQDISLAKQKANDIFKNLK